jgi:tetratricopeptide (TPR) repeat protein/S1-C subfamily serine protease
MKPQRTIPALLFLLFLLTSCVSVDGTPFAELPLPAPATATEAVAAVEFPLLPMSEGEPLRALEIFELVSPSVAYIETHAGSGSGVLINDGYIVSNAHVVWPYNAVRVVFPDGTEFEDVEVVGWDLVADLSLLQLPEGAEVAAAPMTFVDGSQLTMASDIYLIGYPGEVESFPQPAIVQGILGRVRTWSSTGMQVFQVDADVAGGQSGGVMVTERGEVIGITTFRFTSADYGLAPSAAYAVPRLNALANEPGAGLSDRRLLGLSGETEHMGQLEDIQDSDTYILEAEAGEEVEITVEGVGHPRFFVAPIAYGWSYEQSEEQDDNIHSVTFTVEEEDGAFMVEVRQSSAYRNDYTLTSSHPLARYEDADDQTELVMDKVIVAANDFSGDTDTFTIDLQEGEKIAVEVDSLVLAPSISLVYDTPTRQDIVRSYDGGSTSLFGENARLVYEAPKDDTYTFNVYAGESAGGYFITATHAEEDEEVTEAESSETFTLSGFGRLKTYESERYGFAISYPGDWPESYQCGEGMTACFGNPNEAALFVAEEDLDLFPIEVGDMDQEGYADLVEELMLANVPSAKLLTRESITNAQGLVGVKIDISAQAGLIVLSRFIYVSEDDIAFNATYIAAARAYEDLEEFFTYSYKTFRQWDEDNLEDDPAHHLDEGQRLAGEQEYEAALEELNQAIELNPELAQAYAVRAGIYDRMDEFDLAVADYEQAIELDPEEESSYLAQLALLYWAEDELETALEYADQSIALDPEADGLYNNRALIRATAGDFDGALADMDQVTELSPDGELPPHILDSRAYIYLKMEDYEAAKSDYDAALAEDFKSPYVLFGGGIAYARLGMMDEAMELLEYGKELYEDLSDEHPSRQMTDLLEMIAEYIEVE